MKLIDKTPLLDAKGELGFVQRVQGMLKFGFSWPNELTAQKAITTFLDKNLEKGYTLIRNLTLGASEIMVPMILLGPTGIYVIHVTYLRGRYEAKGNLWNQESGNSFKPAPVNLIQRTARLASAVTAFIERQGVKLPISVEPVLMAGNPGLHIESVRPAIKVMMIDGLKPFVSNLSGGRPVLSAELVHELVERLTEPRSPKKETPPAPAPEPRAPWEELTLPPQEAKPVHPTDLDFAMMDGAPAPSAARSIRESSPARPRPRSIPRGKRILGLTRTQLMIVAGLALAVVCLFAVAAYLFLSSPTLLP
ncbi:MAG: nuclease-related domain-containing protein [Anaerolineales bacterium]